MVLKARCLHLPDVRLVHWLYLQQEVNTKHAPTAHRAKERELIELTTRIGELEAQCKTQDEGSAAAQASRNAFLKVKEAYLVCVSAGINACILPSIMTCT